MLSKRNLTSRNIGLGIATAAFLFAAPSLAASGGGGNSVGGSNGDANSSKSSGQVQTCKKKGEVYDASKKKCVAKTSSIFPDDVLYQQGRALALTGDYDNALDLLQSVKNQKDPMVLTMLGYAKRKMGDVAGGFDYYNRALAVDPNNLNTHEYMGEAYIVVGKFDEAKLELKTLEKLCGGKGCEQFDDLAKVLAGEPDLD